MQYINISEAENSPVIYFNTGLDARSFARTKMSQSLAEPGYIVNPDGSHEIWKASGIDEINGFMQFWGPLFKGKRLDLLIGETNGSSQQEALQAVVQWIRAKLFLGEIQTIRNPGAAFINNESVFLAPEHLSDRCLFLENSEQKNESIKETKPALTARKRSNEGIPPDRFNIPDLKGLDSTAFCAGVMLYSVLAKTHPFQSAGIYQDMRDGVFLPISFALPNLDEKLAELIQSALMLPVNKKKPKMSAADILTGILKILIGNDNNVISVSSLFKTLSEEKSAQIDIEKKRFLSKQNSFVKVKRFITLNKPALMISAAVLVLTIIIIISSANTAANRPTTAGMPPENVIHSYFNAFSSMDFEIMEACVNRAEKADINAVVSLTAIIKTRQAYEASMPPVITAAEWKERGGELPAPDVFGVTDLQVTKVSGSENEGVIVFRANYLLWPLYEDKPYSRSDVMTLKPDRKNNWRITEIARTERQ